MDDLDLDRELHTALAATPSPEFVARVRAKIGEASAPSIVPGWLKPAAAIACAAVVAIVVGLPREEARLEPSPTEPAPTTAGLKPSTTYVAPTTPSVVERTPSVVAPTFPPSHSFGEVSPKFAGSVRTTADRSAKAATEPSPARKETPLPEVIVAAEDVEALVQFLSDTQDRRFVASFDETPPSTPWVMNELSIAPIAADAPNPAAHNN